MNENFEQKKNEALNKTDVSCRTCAYWDRRNGTEAQGCGRRFLHLIGFDIATKFVAPCVFVVSQSTYNVSDIGFADNYGCKCWEQYGS